MKIGFIGTGNMAKHMITGFLQKGIAPSDILVSAHNLEKLQAYAAPLGLTVCATNEAVAQGADYLFLGVKPALIPTITKEIAPFLRPEEQLILSFATGISLGNLTQLLGPVPLVRLMPNLNVAVNLGSIAIAFGSEVDHEDQQEITSFLQHLGSVYPFPEDQFSTFVALAGSSPAFIYAFIDALSRTAVKYGLPKKLATTIAAEVVAGSGTLAKKSGTNPWDLVDQVSSPGGSTVEGVLALQEFGFANAITKAMIATLEKDQQSSK